MSDTMLDIAKQALRLATQKGASGVAAKATLDREVGVTWRDGKLEKISEASTRRLDLELYVDGRYTAVSTSDLRPDALGPFLDNAIALTRTLTPDPFRGLPDPALYKDQSTADLELDDPGYTAVTPVERRARAQAMEQAARTVKGSDAIISVTAQFTDTSTESHRVHSNGFEGSRRATEYSASAEATVRDPNGRRPEDWSDVTVRRYADLADLGLVGRQASERALSAVGAKKIPSAVVPVAVDSRVAGNLLRRMLNPLSGGSLQQKRSFMEGKLGKTIGSRLLTIDDDPLLPRGLGSRLYDGEGLTARKRPLFEDGVLKSYCIDVYYGRKLSMAPTSGSFSNVTWKPGTKSQAELLADMKNGVLITGWLGGNSNDTTGDFSLGFKGFAVRGGKIAEPIAEMNLSGNHLETWKKLAAVGNDPYVYASFRTPTLIFDGLQIAGT
ncbi:TldD/PmbA family protein [Chondromyces apiculatus]|uniref:TldE/PmbA protein, part of putative TldE/TldD proteolytic complex n=1 Tax=Chondromyces apiculatus DSM 436 TaxID=1192034 RepID=A0A017T109_9BACT|nr:TldD/PmbA family protein [Chondromyces apiculatus]EYF02525.1 TldE/PmbA protein, part of putative TldE/TldD proteolytic complex [Chondromyces apiculatus DSM 436]